MSENLPSSSHPPLPPTMEEHQVAWLRLLRSRRVGISTFYRLMNDHGWDAEAAVRSLPQLARDAGVEGYSVFTKDAAKDEYRRARMAGARMIARGMAEYPEALAQIDDAPPFFWALGDTQLFNRPIVALVGARNASSLGKRMARSLSEGLSDAGFVVVSGLARGIDAVAHRAALKSGTIAVQAGGVDILYPTENADLARDIGDHGLRISECAFGQSPQARHFPARNRIISGLSKAVVVIEAAAKSGSLITARLAADQGREVFAVPGHPFDARAGGTNILIRDGATLVRGPEDILELLATDEDAPLDAPAPVDERSLADTSALHMEILNRLGPSPQSEDDIVRDVGGNVDAVSALLTELELQGRIERQSGGLLSLRDDDTPPTKH